MTLVFALLVTQGIHLVRGEAAEALAMGDEVVALCREYGLPQEREWSRSFQGAALAALGRLDEGIEQLADSLAVQQAIGAGLVRSAFLAVLADLLRFAGRARRRAARRRRGLRVCGAVRRRRLPRGTAPRESGTAARSPATAPPPRPVSPRRSNTPGAAGPILRAASRHRLAQRLIAARASAPRRAPSSNPIYDGSPKARDRRPRGCTATLDQIR